MEGKEWEAFSDAEVFAKKSANPSIILSQDMTRGKWQIGLLVRDKDKGILAGNIRWVEVLCRLWVRLKMNVNVIKECVDDFHRKHDCTVFADRLDQNQKWCVAGGYKDQEATWHWCWKYSIPKGFRNLWDSISSSSKVLEQVRQGFKPENVLIMVKECFSIVTKDYINLPAIQSVSLPIT